MTLETGVYPIAAGRFQSLAYYGTLGRGCLVMDVTLRDPNYRSALHWSSWGMVECNARSDLFPTAKEPNCQDSGFDR